MDIKELKNRMKKNLENSPPEIQIGISDEEFERLSLEEREELHFQLFEKHAKRTVDEVFHYIVKAFDVPAGDVINRLEKWEDFMLNDTNKNIELILAENITSKSHGEIIYLGFLDLFRNFHHIVKNRNIDEKTICLLDHLYSKLSTLLAASYIRDTIPARLMMAKNEFSERLENAPKIASKKATDSRYNTQRKLLTELGEMARDLWEKGSPLMHNQMKDYLLSYSDSHGKVPFAGLSDSSVLTSVKRVAKDLKRPDLISGQKK